MEVESTEGFPPKGHLFMYAEVLSYERKTATAFHGIKRRAFGSQPIGWHPGAGMGVRDFRGQLKSPDMEPSLENQAEADVYVAVVRKPDAPSATYGNRTLTITPGRRHRETRGFNVYRNGVKVTSTPVTEARRTLSAGAGTYTVTAVEWCGLESEPSEAVSVRNRTLTIANPVPTAK
jgi:hypothetical protein